MPNKITLRGITWNHTRGYVPLAATAQRFNELNPEISIEWSKRSLQEFADSPLDTLAKQYDLLVIDHPWTGFAAKNGIISPLETLLPNDFLENLAHNSVGKSHQSYEFFGSQWALAIDAACPVSAYRKDLLERADAEVPQTFEQLIALADRGLVCCPSIPLDTYGNFLNLLTAANETLFPNNEEVADRDAALLALERLKQLSDRVPNEFFELNPIRSLERMSQTDEFAYMPYTYGYTNYSRSNYAPNLIEFGDVIGIESGKPGATMLGGTGIAISSECKHNKAAAEYVQYVANAENQNGIYYKSGGQPGHRSAWLNPSLNADCLNFFSNTLPTLDRAFIRPRYSGYLDFQDHACFPIHEFLQHGGSTSKLLDKVNKLYRQSLGNT